MTAEKYLEMERAAEFKSEYCDGEMSAMAGGTANHGRLSAKMLYLLSQQLESRNCDVYGSDIRVRAAAGRLYTYPDVSVTCGASEFDSDNLLNPVVIAEVLSASTEGYERGRKFHFYQTIPSLQHYVLVAQDRVQVDLYTRQPNGLWLLSSASRLDAAIELTAIGCSVSLARLYARAKVRLTGRGARGNLISEPHDAGTISRHRAPGRI